MVKLAVVSDQWKEDVIPVTQDETGHLTDNFARRLGYRSGAAYLRALASPMGSPDRDDLVARLGQHLLQMILEVRGLWNSDSEK